MKKEASIYMAGYFLLGFLVIGLMAYMYDFVNKNTIPAEDEKTDIFSGHRKMRGLFLAPFRYLYLNLKNRNYFALLPFTILLALWANVIILGRYMLVKQ